MKGEKAISRVRKEIDDDLIWITWASLNFDEFQPSGDEWIKKRRKLISLNW